MGSIIQPPARRFNKRKIEEIFSRGIIKVLFASKLAMRQRIASKQRDADTARIDTPTEDQRWPNGNDNLRGMLKEHAMVIATTNAKSATKGTVLLQTASCMAVNGSNSIPVHVLFDNRSQ